MEFLALDERIRAHRDAWRYRGQARPEFAEATAPGEESVWDFPRPPIMQTVDQTVRVCLGDRMLAASDRAVRVLETAGAPTVYVPPEEVDAADFVAAGRSLCEWKGLAQNYTLADGRPCAWLYERVYPEFAAIAGWFSFYPNALDCYIGDEQVRAQPGGYYGGWVTSHLKGPIKGGPGSSGW